MSETCSSCRYYGPLSPGHAAICFEKWSGLSPYDAVPLTSKDEWCEKHTPKILNPKSTPDAK